MDKHKRPKLSVRRARSAWASASRDTIERQAELDAKTISVAVDGHKVTLNGSYEGQAAERAAWSAPGVTQAVDRIVVY